MKNKFKPSFDSLDSRNLTAVPIPLAPGVVLAPIFVPTNPAPPPERQLPGAGTILDPTMWEPPQDPEWGGDGGAGANW